MNRTIEATVRRDHYGGHEPLRAHLADFIATDNDGRRLGSLLGPTPFEAICKARTADPSRFRLNPFQLIPRPNS